MNAAALATSRVANVPRRSVEDRGVSPKHRHDVTGARRATSSLTVGQCKLDPSLKAPCFQPLDIDCIRCFQFEPEFLSSHPYTMERPRSQLVRVSSVVPFAGSEGGPDRNLGGIGACVLHDLPRFTQLPGVSSLLGSHQSLHPARRAGTLKVAHTVTAFRRVACSPCEIYTSRFSLYT